MPKIATTTAVSQSLPEFEISIVPGSHINLVSSASRVPIQIRNDYDTDIRIFIWVRPSNLSVKMPKVFEYTAAANTTSNAAIPVEAIANGEVRLNVWLTSFSGVKIGKSTNLAHRLSRTDRGELLLDIFDLIEKVRDSFWKLFSTGAFDNFSQRIQKYMFACKELVGIDAHKCFNATNTSAD